MGISDETTDEQTAELTTSELKVYDASSRKRIIRDKAVETARKLCHLGRSLSLGTVPSKHEYVGLQTSPDEVQSCLRHYRTSPETRTSHPLTRQIAVEDKHCGSNSSLKIFKKGSRGEVLNTYPTFTFGNVGHSPDTSNLSTPTLSNSPHSSHHTFEEHRDLRHFTTGSRHFSDSDFRKYSSAANTCMPSHQQHSILKEKVPTDACVISSIDPPLVMGTTMSRIRSARSIIEHERRVRIRKLQSDLLRIQKELQDLHELEYEVSCV